jgi:hypothetical protein
MAAGDLTALRTGLAANLNAITTPIPKLTITAYMETGLTPPFIWIRPGDPLVLYHQAMRNGVETWHLLIQGYAGAVTDVAAQQTYDALLSGTGASSVKAAAESDLTLGGACSSLQVIEVRGYTEFTRPDGATLVGAEWDVEILT